MLHSAHSIGLPGGRTVTWLGCAINLDLVTGSNHTPYFFFLTFFLSPSHSHVFFLQKQWNYKKKVEHFIQAISVLHGRGSNCQEADSLCSLSSQATLGTTTSALYPD